MAEGSLSHFQDSFESFSKNLKDIHENIEHMEFYIEYLIFWVEKSSERPFGKAMSERMLRIFKFLDFLLNDVKKHVPKA